MKNPNLVTHAIQFSNSIAQAIAKTKLPLIFLIHSLNLLWSCFCLFDEFAIIFFLS